MTNQYYNFNYDPSKQGFDETIWRKVYGDVVVSSGQLQFSRSLIINYADILRGDAYFDVSLASLATDGTTRFGFTLYSKGMYAQFKISGSTLTAETSDGVTSKSIVIPWNADWSGVNTIFRIKWEAGLVLFYIAGSLRATISTESSLDIPVSVVPSDPMSLFLENDTTALFILNNLTVLGIQSYLATTGNADSLFEKIVTESDRITITENITLETFGMSASASPSPSASKSPSSSLSASPSPSASRSPSTSVSPSSSSSPSNSPSLSPSSSVSASRSPSSSTSSSVSPSSSTSSSDSSSASPSIAY